MLETVLLRQSTADADRPLDLGVLAEALLYYGRVRLLMNRGTPTQLLRDCGAETIIRLVESPNVEAYYINGGTAMRTENTGTVNEEHQPIFFSIPGWNLENIARDAFQAVTGRAGTGRRLAARFVRSVREAKVDDAVLTDVLPDYADASLMNRLAVGVIRAIAPTVSTDHVEISVEPVLTGRSGNWVKVKTNIDFSEVTAAWQRRSAGPQSFTAGYLLASALSVLENLYFAGLYSADLVVDPVQSTLIGEKCRALLRGQMARSAEIENFQTNLFGDAHAVAEAINGGHRSIGDVLDILENAQRFREWVAGRPPDG